MSEQPRITPDSRLAVLNERDRRITDLESQLAAAREREKQLRERAESGDAAVAMCNRWYEAAMTHYPLNWAVEPGNPELVIGNIVRNIEDGHRALLAEAHKDIAATIERAERAEKCLSEILGPDMDYAINADEPLQRQAEEIVTEYRKKEASDGNG